MPLCLVDLSSFGKIFETVFFFLLFFRELCRFILESKGCNSDDYQLGTTRVFLRENLERTLEKERSEILHKAAITLQTNVRGYLARRKYQNIKKSTIKLQVKTKTFLTKCVKAHKLKFWLGRVNQPPWFM